MVRISGTLILAAALVLASGSAGQDGPKDKLKPDPARLFKLSDRDKDGKLSKAEFSRLVSNGPRFKDKIKDNPKLVDLLFGRLDEDGDGSLSPAEFKQFGAMGQGKGKAKEKPAKEKVEKERPATAEGVAFFEKKIRPVLIAECYKCHSAEKDSKVRGGLTLDTRDGLRKGGDSGPAIVLGNASRSLLVKAIKHADDKLAMPPKKKLADNVVRDFEQWVTMGAPDPRDGTRAVRSEIDIEKGRAHWAFQPVKKPAAPAVKNAAWPRSDVDRHLLTALEAKGLSPVEDADRRTLIRRVTFDLTGLPPTPEEVEAFVKDASEKAFEKVVDRLLQSPRFGERFGRHWLDVARYAETSGKAVNLSYPHAWRYRDWVIAAFNADKPYDQFVKEQLAGDLLPSSNAQEKAERQIATGFLALGPKLHNERNRLQFEMDVVDEQIDATTQAFLGLTVACARCHDHKFDPVPQKDYYALAGIFRSTETLYGTIRLIQNAHPSALATLGADSGQPAGVEKLSPRGRETLTRQLDRLKQRRDELRKEGPAASLNQNIFLSIQIQTQQSRLDSYDAEGNPKLLAMGVRERGFPRDSVAYQRGEVDKPGDRVPRGFVQVASREPARITRGSGRHELADWLASADNPLTARVMANRVWGWLFGRGLVASPDNFGTTGEKPSHPELLDYLAASFVEHGWSVKKLVRQLVLTRTYELASTHSDKCYEIDPENTLLWRMSKRRLEAEALRDAMLFVAGELAVTPPVGSEIAKLGEGFANGVARLGPIDGRTKYRSVYLPVARDVHLDSLALFDFADSSVVVGERATTSVPAQSLFLLNNPFVIRLSEVAARRLLAKGGDDRERLEVAYQRFFARKPSEKEAKLAEAFLASYSAVLAKDGVAEERRRPATWAAMCQAMYGSAEFLYRD
jgi:cytochrome c553